MATTPCFEKSYLLSPTTWHPIGFPIFPESATGYALTGFDVTFQDLATVLYHQGFRVAIPDFCSCPDTPASSQIDPPIPADYYGRKFFAVNLIMYRGDSKQFAFQIINQLDKTAIDLSGWNIRFEAKWEYADPDGSAVITKTNPSGITLTDPTNGQLTVFIVPGDTTAIRGDGEPVIPYSPATDLYYDLQGTDPSGAIYTLVSGKLTIRPEVVRS